MRLFVRVWAVACLAVLVACTDHAKPISVATPTPSVSVTPTPAFSPARSPSKKPSPRSTVTTDCASTDLSIKLTSDRATYASQQDVNFRTTATNTSDHPCRTIVGSCPDPVQVDDAKGRQVWTATPKGFGGCAALGGITLAPGHSQSLTTEWDQRTCEPGACPGSFVPPGRYAGIGNWEASDGEVAAPPLRVTIT